ncbi:hypothetical protein [Actinomyces trachealis]|nr:hypothetical protein [Actinomyces trachealis]
MRSDTIKGSVSFLVLSLPERFVLELFIHYHGPAGLTAAGKTKVKR